MALSSAFARSRTLMARHDVSPHLVKWWKGVRPDEGQSRGQFDSVLNDANGDISLWVIIGPAAVDRSLSLGACKVCASGITRHLSPFEQQIILPWLKTWPKRAYDKFADSGPYLVTTFVLVYGIAAASDAADAAQDRSYRY
ncbi:hypothetical protein HJC23_004805 [Cyclotella cryptica]|uniref:Uncharacterized protein n=1 Tax=Cyclotella cryptica TaxID=29204 RepID=A0ABD3PXQ6_9STRA